LALWRWFQRLRRCVVQGADNVIQERLSLEGKRFWPPTQKHLEEFGRMGLRTLCLAYK
jgi:magnesium-transporting ATPase (P-type)